MEISASSKNITPFYALIAAGGSGSRMGGDVPKQYQKMAGKSILRHTLDIFLSCEGLQELCVIIDPAHMDLYTDAVKGLNLPDPVAGGKERNISINNGLKYFSKLKKEDVILIHDAARPLINPHYIQTLAYAAKTKGGATLATPVTDTQKYAGGTYIEREGLWSIQTPQGFHYGLLVKAHENANENTRYTDDSSMVAALGHDIEIVQGPRTNFKITTPDDLLLAEKLMTQPFETRTGFGYDVHAFTDGNNIRLCGINIPHDKSLKGHSDADAGLHALTDALLGTIGAGDIGTYFPPSDPQWKDKDSAVFLKHAVDMIVEKSGVISNLDLTLICEQPKISPHREAMQARIGEICGLSADRIGLKATTNEKLGFIGRGEGIAAQAVASVRFPVKDSADA